MISRTLKGLRYLGHYARQDLMHLNLQILYQCNFKCRICEFWRDPTYRVAPMALSEAERAIEKLRPLAPLVVSIGGGEPLLHPDLTAIVRLLARDHFPVMICNGWYVTPEKARELFAAGLQEVSISVDYADPQAHDRQRGVPGAFDHAVAALRILHENRTDPNQRVHMISVVMHDNLDDIERLILLARQIGVTYLVTKYSRGRGTGPSDELDADVSARLLALKERYPDFVSLRGYLARFTEAGGPVGVLPCYAGKHLFNIDCRGNVSRCIDRLGEAVGNILTDDLVTLRERLYEQHLSNRCGACWTSCRGSIESLLGGTHLLGSLRDLRQMVRPVSLRR